MDDSSHRTSRGQSYGSMKTITKTSTKTNSNSSLPKIIEELNENLTDTSSEAILEGPTVSVEDLTAPTNDIFMMNKVMLREWNFEQIKMIASNILFACAVLIYFLRNFCNGIY